MEQVVEYVEGFCDALEQFFTKDVIKELEIYDKTVSGPASIAALRLHYYVLQNIVDTMGESDKIMFTNHQLRYNKLAFLLMNETSSWNRLSYKEKAALLIATNISSIFVYVRNDVQTI
jgi:hypothetical protein